MKLKTLLPLISLSALMSISVQAEEVTYSTEGYCLLAKEGVSERYLEAYAKKLGMTPSRKVCKSFNDFVANVKPKEWDYQGGKLYPGSVIRLSNEQIEKIRAAKAK